VGVLAPGQSVRVQVDFCPEATPHPADAAGGAALAAGEGEGEGGKDAAVAPIPATAAAAEGEGEGEGEGDGEGEEGAAQGAAAGGRGVNFGSDVKSRPGSASANQEPAPRCNVWRLPLFRKVGPPPNTKLSVGGTCPSDILEIEGLFTQGSEPGRAFGESVGWILEMESSDWSSGIRYHFFDTRPDTEF
jgi:hypothetical protein